MSSTSFAGVRVVLDLELFFKDKRRKCYYYIDFSQYKIVGDVCNGIKASFKINEDIALEINGCYVPEDENVRILYNEDVVRVVDANGNTCFLPIQNGKCDGQRNSAEGTKSLSNSFNDKKLKQLDTQEQNESDECALLSKPKKRKKSRKAGETKENKYCEEDMEETENIPRKRKHMTELVHVCSPLKHGNMTKSKENKKEPNVLNSSVIDIHEISAGKEEVCGENEHIETEPLPVLEHEGGDCENVCSTIEFFHKQIPKLEPFNVCVSSTFLKTNNNDEKKDRLQNGRNGVEEDEYLEHNGKKKRRRNRKKIRNTDNCFVQHITGASVIMQSPLKTPKHIKFVDEDEEHRSYDNDSKHNDALGNNAVNRCIPPPLPAELESSNVNNRNAIKNENNAQSNADIPVTDNISIVTENSDICSNFVMQASNTPLIFECKRTNRLQSTQSEKRDSEPDFSKYPLLNDAPKANDIIVFKKLKMDSNYCPNISHYISAKVLQISENDNLITLRILNGHEELKEPKGKFSLNEENEAEIVEEVINDIIEINITDLLDIRLLFP